MLIDGIECMNDTGVCWVHGCTKPAVAAITDRIATCGTGVPQGFCEKHAAIWLDPKYAYIEPAGRLAKIIAVKAALARAP
jgi:hypothetical protein